MKTPFSRRKWWLLPVILLAVSVIWWLLIDPADGDMQIQKQTLSDSVSVGTLTPKTQVHTPLFSGSADSWAADNAAADLPQVELAADRTTDIRMDFGLLTAPHKVKVTAWEVRDIDYSRDIGLWLKHSTPRDMPHSYTPGLLEIPLTRDDRVPRQLLVIEATWYGILGPKTGTYAVTVLGWQATPEIPADPIPEVPAKPVLPPPEDLPYSTQIQNPKTFTYTAAEDDTPETAALALACLYMDDLMLPSDERTFRVTAYKKPQMAIVSPTIGFVPPNEDSYRLADDEIAENTWIVDFDARYLFAGTVSPIGHRPEADPEKDSAEWIFPMYEGSRVGFLMTKNGSEYTLRSRWGS